MHNKLPDIYLPEVRFHLKDLETSKLGMVFYFEIIL